MTGRRIAAVAGLLLLLAGLTLALLPRTAQGVGCGSVLIKGGEAGISDLLGETVGAEAACTDALSAARVLAGAPFVVGAALLLGSALAGPRKAAPD